MLSRFHSNDPSLAMQYAMDTGFLRLNGAQVQLPSYHVEGCLLYKSFTALTMNHLKDLKSRDGPSRSFCAAGWWPKTAGL